MSAGQPIPRQLASFIDYLKIERGLAPLTVAAYTRDICQFAEFLKKRSLTAARRQDVRDFLDHLFSHQVDGRSVARKLSAIFAALPNRRMAAISSICRC